MARPPRNAAFLMLFFGAAMGCGADVVTLVVDVKTDFVPGDEFASVETRVASPRVLEYRISPTGREDFLAGERVAELEVPRTSLDLTVRLVDRRGAAVAQRLATVDARSTTGVTILISRACTDVVCPGLDDPENATACFGGLCADPSCTPETPERCPSPGCTGDGDCGAGSACTQGRCVDGACFQVVDDAMCDPGTRCHPAVGCTPDSDGPYPDCGSGSGDVTCIGDCCVACADTGCDVTCPTGATCQVRCPPGAVCRVSCRASCGAGPAPGPEWDTVECSGLACGGTGPIPPP